jgi:hypothetical protein
MYEEEISKRDLLTPKEDLKLGGTPDDSTFTSVVAR